MARCAGTHGTLRRVSTLATTVRGFVGGALSAAGAPWLVDAVEGTADERVHRVTLRDGDRRFTLRIGPRDEGARVFRRTASFNVSYEGKIEHGTRLFDALQAVVDVLAAADDGGFSWEAARRSLPLVAGLKLRQPEWSRELFDRNVASVPPDAGEHGVVIVVHQSCLMNCSFCPEPDLALPARETYDAAELSRHQGDLFHQLAWGRRVGARMVEFGGNDVLRYPPAIELFDEARRLGYTRVIAQSPGQSLASRDFAARVAGSGVTEVHIPIYGSVAAQHDAVVGVAGAFEDMVRGVDNLLSLGSPTVMMHTIVLRSRLAWLEETLAFVERRFGLVARVTSLRPNRDDDRHHFADITPIQEVRALATARAKQFVEQPLCGFERGAADERTEAFRAVGHDGRPYSFYDLGRVPGMENEAARRRRQRADTAACRACGRRDACSGVLGSYVEQWGEAGLVPFE